MLIFIDLGDIKSENNSFNPRTNFVLHGDIQVAPSPRQLLNGQGVRRISGFRSECHGITKIWYVKRGKFLWKENGSV